MSTDNQSDSGQARSELSVAAGSASVLREIAEYVSNTDFAAELIRAADEIDRLRRDEARLDWMGHPGAVWDRQDRVLAYWDTDFREAVDMAMRESEPNDQALR